MNFTRRREICPTCQQPITAPTPSKVILVRVGMAAFAVGSGLIEYRRAVRRETEAAQLEQLHDTSADVPLDEHLDQREPSPVDERRDPANPFDVVRSIDLHENGEHTFHTDDGQQLVEPTPWPPSHPSLAALDDASTADAAD